MPASGAAARSASSAESTRCWAIRLTSPEVIGAGPSRRTEMAAAAMTANSTSRTVAPVRRDGDHRRGFSGRGERLSVASPAVPTAGGVATLAIPRLYVGAVTRARGRVGIHRDIHRLSAKVRGMVVTDAAAWRDLQLERMRWTLHHAYDR